VSSVTIDFGGIVETTDAPIVAVADASVQAKVITMLVFSSDCMSTAANILRTKMFGSQMSLQRSFFLEGLACVPTTPKGRRWNMLCDYMGT
jgi:hypothetical protein